MNDYEPSAMLARYQAEFEAGNGEALLHAVSLCLNRGVPAPSWVATAFNAAWEIRWYSGQARTLDEAFDVKRPKNWSQKRARKNAFTWIAWQWVVRHHQNGEPLGRILFERVAEELNADFGSVANFNGTDVQDAYYSVKRLAENRSKSR